MVFSSLVFLFLFFPLVLFLYFYSKNIKVKNLVLFIFSLLFYAWGEPIYILLMLFSIFVNYIGAILIDKSKDIKRKVYFITLVVINLLMLGYFKYIVFILDNINVVFNLNKFSNIKVILPIGISFYTFQILSYVIDVYRRKVRVQKSILNLGLYISLFPQLVAGPIVRYETIEKELKERKETLEKFVSGMKRFIYGLGKKVIIANNVALIADAIYNGNIYDYGTSVLWLAAIAYTIQIYFDFSGYSDMAIGMGKMFGFTFLENFNYPYIATNITEFWRRWHISLSSWFRDYVYIPLGGNRVSKVKWIRNIMLVWLLTGLWHGASWNYVLWGLYYGVILLLEKEILSSFLKKHRIIARLYTILLFIIGWVIFRLENFHDMFYALQFMFSYKPDNIVVLIVNNKNLIFGIPFMFLGIVGSLPLFNYVKTKQTKNIYLKILEMIYLIFIFGFSVASLISVKYNPFIYFKF